MKNGFILFYTLTESSKKYGQESTYHRLLLDETMRIEAKSYLTDKNSGKEYERFTLRIGK